MDIKNEEDELNMEAYMDVVTTYNCKFCGLSFHSPQDITKHVKEAHLPRKNVAVEKQLGQCGTVNTIAMQTHSAPEQANMSGISRENEVQTWTGQLAVEEVTTEQVPVSETNSTFSIVRKPAVSLLTGQIHETHMEVVTETHTEDDKRSVHIQAEPQISEAQETDTEAVLTGSERSVELYLCGQCNVGFDAIEECKVHMMETHNDIISTEESLQQGGEVTANVQLKKLVHASTQVDCKRPGRKKKPKGVIPVPLPQIEPQDYEEHNYDADTQDTETDLSNKRRIRPPKALREDYYLGNRKNVARRNRLRRMLIIKPTNIRCPRKGCTAKFHTEEGQEMHEKCHKVDENTKFRFTCYECPTPFVTWKLLRMHLWKTHSIDVDLMACDKCMFKTDGLSKLESHYETHSDDRPYICTICGKGFKQVSQLANHEVIHGDRRNEKDKWYSTSDCTICGRTFVNKKCLKKHIEAVHDKLKPFACPYCSHTTARKAMMDLHIRTHTGEKPHKCDLCTYATGDYNCLRRHRMRHTGQKPYSCNHCSYSCIQAISLKTHMKNKHPGLSGIYCCDLCQFRSVSKNLYDNHVVDHEKGLITSQSANEKKLAKNPIIQIKEVTGQTNAPDGNSLMPMTIDMSKPGNYEVLGNHDMNATQLILSALNVMSQQACSVVAVQGMGGNDQVIQNSNPNDNPMEQTLTFEMPTSQANTKSQAQTVSVISDGLQVLQEGQLIYTVKPENNTNANQMVVESETVQDKSDAQNVVLQAAATAGITGNESLVDAQTQDSHESLGDIITVEDPSTHSQILTIDSSQIAAEYTTATTH